MSNAIYEILENKVVLYSEIVVFLFEHCNFNCSFCFQNHNDITGATRKEIMHKAKMVVDYIKSNKRSQGFNVQTMGGELFQDIWINKDFLSIYEEYVNFIKSNTGGIDVQINFVTNLAFEKTSKDVLDFLEKNDLYFIISYDSRGRFTEKQLITFKENVEIFKNRIKQVGCVSTKQNFEAVISGDTMFDYLYSMFPCVWDSFIPSKKVKNPEKIMPKESDMLKFQKHLVDNYPECINIKPFVDDSTHNRMSCTRGNSYVIMPNNETPKGCMEAKILKDPISPDLASGAIIEKFLKQYNCLECEFYQKCPFSCFIKNEYSKLERDVGECIFKETFKYAKEKKKNEYLA